MYDWSYWGAVTKDINRFRAMKTISMENVIFEEYGEIPKFLSEYNASIGEISNCEQYGQASLFNLQCAYVVIVQKALLLLN